eukprot:scaffold64434_cov52-Cyclotella_meneghiniana.AAC.12
MLLQLATVVLLFASSHEAAVSLDDIQNSILSGNLLRARRIANACLAQNVNQRQLLTAASRCPSSEDIMQAYKHYTSLLYEKEQFLDIVINATQSEYELTDRVSSKLQSSNDCWDGTTSISNVSPFGIGSALPDVNRWNECCSFFKTHKPSKCYGPSNSTSQLCCDFSVGTDNYLALPALKEPYLTINLAQLDSDTASSEKHHDFIELDQEGQLGLYDVSGVLWPSGYLLGLCLNDPIFCGVPEIVDSIQRQDFTMALELGAGVGFPSIVFAKSMNRYTASLDRSTCQNDHVCVADKQSSVVVATDSSKSSLGLVIGNSYRNDVERLVNVSVVDHMNPESLALLQQRFYPSGGGFDLIFGSSLQGFFDETSNPNAALWHSLDLLLSKVNRDALVLLVHVRTEPERIKVPDGTGDCSMDSFELVRRISGDVFQLKTRDGNTSDFEIVVLRRRACD